LLGRTSTYVEVILRVKRVVDGLAYVKGGSCRGFCLIESEEKFFVEESVEKRYLYIQYEVLDIHVKTGYSAVPHS